MGYLDIIDSLSDKRVDEGMISSISKNSSSIDTDKLLKVLLDFDIQSLPRKNIKSNLSFYNKSPFSKIDSVVKSDMLPSAMSVRELVDVVDGRFSKIDKYVDWIHDYLKEEGYNYIFDTHGFELVAIDREEEVLSGAYSTFSVCVGDEFFDAFTDEVLDNVLDAKAEVYLANTYSKLKLPTIGCRLTVTFTSSKDAKDFLSSVSDIKSWVNTVTVKGKSLVIEVY